MLKLRKLEATVCATCKRPVSLAQVNGKTFAVEPSAGVIASSLVILEIHRCDDGEVSVLDRPPFRPR